LTVNPAFRQRVADWVDEPSALDHVGEIGLSAILQPTTELQVVVVCESDHVCQSLEQRLQAIRTRARRSMLLRSMGLPAGSMLQPCGRETKDCTFTPPFPPNKSWIYGNASPPTRKNPRLLSSPLSDRPAMKRSARPVPPHHNQPRSPTAPRSNLPLRQAEGSATGSKKGKDHDGRVAACG